MASLNKSAYKFLRGVSSRNNLPVTAFNSASQFKQISETVARDIIKNTNDSELKSEGLDYLKKITKIENPKHLGSSEWTSVIFLFSNLLNDCIDREQLESENLEAAKLGVLSALDLGDELNSHEIINLIEKTVNRLSAIQPENG